MKTLYTSSPHAFCRYVVILSPALSVRSQLEGLHHCWFSLNPSVHCVNPSYCDGLVYVCVCGAILSVASRRAPDLSYLPFITSLEENEWDPHSEESRAKCNLGNSLFQSTLMGKGGTRRKRAIEWLNGGSERMVCPALCVPQCVS